MDRRELLAAGTLGTIGLALSAARANAQEMARLTYHSRLDKTHMTCLDHCTACSTVCNEASAHCLSEVAKGPEEKAHHTLTHQLTMDCAAICGVSATLIARQSPLMGVQCQACSEACRRCAEACEKHASMAEIMKDCATICRACESSCRDMARAMGGRVGAAN